MRSNLIFATATIIEVRRLGNRSAAAVTVAAIITGWTAERQAVAITAVIDSAEGFGWIGASWVGADEIVTEIDLSTAVARIATAVSYLGTWTVNFW